MICRQCGTEIADKALICYRCGTATAEPRVRPPAPAARRSGPPALLALVALVALVLGALYLGQLPEGDLPRWVVYVVSALAGLAVVWWLLTRRRR